ncbi:MAG TPA: pitrilysin family protein [Thermoanaerobaculia bacterium]|nr:pitrilysin family protein [Thermoanaerobaculia bacterium]
MKSLITALLLSSAMNVGAAGLAPPNAASTNTTTPAGQAPPLQQAQQITQTYRDIKVPPLRAFSLPQPKRIELSNGMVIFLMEDHELPLIRGSATIRGGERDVPADHTGLVRILGSAWRTGGTTTKTGDALDDLLESRAARVETAGGDDSMSVGLDVLKGDFDAVFPIFVDVLRNPAFREDKIELAKTLLRSAISRRNDEPGSILSRQLTKLAYGAQSVYAREPEYATVAKVTRDDLLAFHKRFVVPNNIILAFVGDFDSAKMEKTLRTTFASWPRGQAAPRPVEDIQPAKPGVYFVEKADVTQANIGMAHLGTTRNNPDYAALSVLNQIFSGGFSGRLMQRLRSQRGLTYGAGGGVGMSWDHPGAFRASMSTKSSTAIEGIDALRGEVAALTRDPVTPEELALAKETLLNEFIFQNDTRAKVLNQAVLLEFYGYPKDFFQRYPSLIEKVTAADVQRVAQKYVHPDQLAVLVVGTEKDFEKPLGNVTRVDVTIPE